MALVSGAAMGDNRAARAPPRRWKEHVLQEKKVIAGDTPRILVISPNWIGDAVMAQPLLQLLRAAHPDQPLSLIHI